jgi:glycosyltransferase involved in cell wall biosynthesis
MDNAEYPRVLVIAANPLNEEFNNGLTMLNLFREWPSSSLCQIYAVSATEIQPDFSVCNQYWRISLGSCLAGIVGIHRYLSVTPEAPRKRIGGVAAPPTAGRNLIHALARNKLMLFVFELLRDRIYSDRAMISQSLVNYLDRFRPEVIVGAVGNNIVMRLVLKLANKYNIPSVPWFGDDWIVARHRGVPFSGGWRRREDNLLRQLLASSPVRLVICDAMGAEYSSRYGGVFLTVANLLESARYNPAYEGDSGSLVRFNFFGGLHLGRWKSLRRIAQALDYLYAEEGLNAELGIQTHPHSFAEYGACFKNAACVRVKEFVPYGRVPDELRKSEVLVYVEPFGQDDLEMTRLTFSTKLPEYLMAGRCILAFGPPTSASMRFLQEGGCGIIVGNDDIALLTNAIRRLILDCDYRRGFGETGRALGVERFDAVKQRKVFRDLLSSAIADHARGNRTP